MSGKLCVSISTSKDNLERTSIGFVVANAALAADNEVMIWLSIEGVWLIKPGFADSLAHPGIKPLAELLGAFVTGGGTLVACSTCCATRGLSDQPTIDGASIAGSVKLVEFLSGGTPCVSY